jgi:hypothetical protein
MPVNGSAGVEHTGVFGQCCGTAGRSSTLNGIESCMAIYCDVRVTGRWCSSAYDITRITGHASSDHAGGVFL